MATVQKTISESSSYTTKTLTTTISAPGIRHDAEISVSPSIDASKVSYTINEAAGTIKVTLTNATYTSNQYNTVSAYYVCTYGYADGGQFIEVFTKSCPSSIQTGPSSYGLLIDEDYRPGYGYYTYYFNYTITVTYSTKTFPEFKVRQGGQVKNAIDGWVRVNGHLKPIHRMWARVNGQLKEV